MNKENIYQPNNIFKTRNESAILLILNQPLPNIKYFKLLWENTAIHVVADGGANRLFHLFDTEQERDQYLPDFIEGDLDSLTDDVKNYYLSKNISIKKNQCQDSTDFMKCLALPMVNKSEDYIYVLGALSGRLDHTISAMHVLLLNPLKRIVLLSNDSMAFLIPIGSSTIHSCVEIEKDTCGLFPLTGKAICFSAGLKWNLDHTLPLAFGDLISTSNAFDPNYYDENLGIRKVVLKTDRELIWTVELDLN
ncbi:thiamine pyrophosphokinase [Globomyces pollinis-pini]|nr:thiamine pyrophosphokinase [Globomyces pollinis-pini]